MSTVAGLAVCVGVAFLASSVAAQPPSEDDQAKSRALYKEAEELAKAGQWQEAANKYEEAYYLLPSKHGFAYKIGTAAWQAEDCVRADKYLSHFRTYGSSDKHPEYMIEADRILNEIEFKGCAEPPPVDETEASKKGCAVGGGSGDALGLFVLGILALCRRQR